MARPKWVKVGNQLVNVNASKKKQRRSKKVKVRLPIVTEWTTIEQSKGEAD
jgi:hypothetical protein